MNMYSNSSNNNLDIKQVIEIERKTKHCDYIENNFNI